MLHDYAEQELKAAGLFDEDGLYDGMIGKAVMELIDVFAAQGHSGMSAEITRDAFDKVASYKPLAPLSGEDDEWNEVVEGVWQNKRCSTVFRQTDRFDGQAYDIDGKVFREPNGSCFTSADSRTPITFPYTPHTEIVDVEAQTEE
jgi:hypothetical protein